MKISIATCRETTSIAESAIRLTNMVAYNRKRGYATGIDGKNYWQTAPTLHRLLQRLDRQVYNGTFDFQPSKKITRRIKNKTRDLYISNWTDKFVERWLNDAINKCLHNWFCPNSYAYRSSHFGLDNCQANLQKAIRPGSYIIKRDISNYFYTINHDKLLGQLKELFDDDLYDLVKQRIVFEYMEDDERRTAIVGIPFGSPLACSLANIYLTSMDKAISELPVSYFRYADDFLVICRDRDTAITVDKMFDEHLSELCLGQKPSHRINATFGDGDDVFTKTSSIKYLGLQFNTVGTASLTREKQRKIFNIFKRNLELVGHKIKKLASIDERLKLIIATFNDVVLDRIRSVAIIDYYLKHINDVTQLRVLDMRLAQHVISLALGKPFRYRDFSTIPYGKLRQMGLLSLVHRHTLHKHGKIDSSFMSLCNELTLKRYTSSLAIRRDRINQMRLRRAIESKKN